MKERKNICLLVDQTTLGISVRNNMSQTRTVIYAPCHYDLSHIEYVAPFLERYHGSKVFVYNWNGLRDRMLQLYRSPEYQKCGVEAMPFSLQNIIRAACHEPPGTQIIVLLTAGMAYALGSYQRELLSHLKQVLPGRIWGISVVGHCMYGCMSCSGNDHKVPVYFSRYYNRQLEYTGETIHKQYFEKLQHESRSKYVLVCPSTGETSIMQQPTVIHLLKKLQDEGRYHFIFKLHPASYNESGYDPDTPSDQIEKSTLEFIFANFAVTNQDQPCLLPFMEKAKVIICDLHSSVGFMACYFAPNVVMAYHNDADYDVPDRDPEFLAGLNVFDDASHLEKLMQTLPEPKGDPAFFKKVYGIVDGKEIDRFAALSKWPSINDSVVGADVDYSKSWRQYLSKATDIWIDVLKQAKMRPNADGEDYYLECRRVSGLDGRFDFPETPTPTISLPPIQVSRPQQSFRIVSFNIWYGGSGHPDNLGVKPIAQALVALKLDVACLQEVAERVDSQGNRKNHLVELCQTLNDLEPDGRKTWQPVDQGIITPGRGCICPWGMLSRLPIKQRSQEGFGILVALETSQETNTWVFNTHLPYFPYQPYQAAGIPYEDAPNLSTEAELQQSCIESRGKEVQLLLNDINNSIRLTAGNTTTAPYIFLGGDFNEPSCFDWTTRAVVAGVHSLKCAWISTKTLKDAGFDDVYRMMHPDEVSKPGFTWCERTEENSERHADPKKDHHDRIDFVLMKKIQTSSNLLMGVQRAEIFGSKFDVVGQLNDAGIVDKAVCESPSQWPSDHRGVFVEIGMTFI